MSKITRKNKKTIGFSDEELAVIEAYRAVTGEDFSPAVVSLAIKGLENNNTVKTVQKKFDYSITKLVDRLFKFENRMANLIVGLARIQGKIHALVVVMGIRNSSFEKDELKNLENQGIKKSIEELSKNIDDMMSSLNEMK